MGWNEGYTIMEKTVIAAYDGGLRGEQLAPFLEQYRGTDIDEGGREDLKSQDGKNIDEIILEAFGSPEDLRRYQECHGKIPLTVKNPEDLKEEIWDSIFAITKGRFGWG